MAKGANPLNNRAVFTAEALREDLSKPIGALAQYDEFGVTVDGAALERDTAQSCRSARGMAVGSPPPPTRLRDHQWHRGAALLATSLAKMQVEARIARWFWAQMD